MITFMFVFGAVAMRLKHVMLSIPYLNKKIIALIFTPTNLSIYCNFYDCKNDNV